MSNPTPKICSLCRRPVGMLRLKAGALLARSWTTTLTEDGVSIVCQDVRSCKVARSKEAA